MKGIGCCEQYNLTADERYCYDCIHNEVCRWCPHDGCDFKETLKEAAKSDTDKLLREVLPILRAAFFVNHVQTKAADELYDRIMKAVRE